MINHHPICEEDITTLFSRNIRVLRTQFVSDILEVYSDLPVDELSFDNKIVVLHFKFLQEKNWGASDFLALCEQSPVILLDNLPQIDLSDRNLARRFILFIGGFN